MLIGMISDHENLINEESMRKITINVGYYGGYNFDEIVKNIEKDFRQQHAKENIELKIEVPFDPNLEVKQYISKDKYLHIFEYPMYNYEHQHRVLKMSDF